MDKTVEDIIFERLEVIESKIDTNSEGTKIENWMQEAFNAPGTIDGIVVDEGKARESDCRRIALGDSSHLVYSKGIVGALNHDQEKLYCTNITDVDIPPEVAARTKILRDATIICQEQVHDLPADERLAIFMPCLVREAKKKGLEI